MDGKAMRSLFSLFLALMLLPGANALAQEKPEYAAMKGVDSAKTVFDFRVGDPKVALGHLNLMHDMLDEPSMQVGGKPPEMVVVFIGPSVKLISSEEQASAGASAKAGAGAAENAAIAKKISAMDRDGVRFEVCMTTAQALDIPAESILPEVVQVKNGWISLVGYQHKDYAMIADF